MSEEVSRNDIYKKETIIDKTTKINLGLAASIIVIVISGVWKISIQLTNMQNQINTNKEIIMEHTGHPFLHESGFSEVARTYETKTEANLKDQLLIEKLDDLKSDITEIKRRL